MFLLPKSKDIGLFKKQRKEIQSVPIPLLKALREQIATERFKSERWTKSGQNKQKRVQVTMNSNEVQFKAKSITWNKGDKGGQDRMRKSGLECSFN